MKTLLAGTISLQGRARNSLGLLLVEFALVGIAALCRPATYWLTGNTLHVDGGENIVG